MAAPGDRRPGANSPLNKALGSPGRPFRAACRWKHPSEDPVAELVMVIERRERMTEGKDDDRPAGIFVERVNEAPCRPVDCSIGSWNRKEAEETYRMALRPAEG